MSGSELPKEDEDAGGVTPNPSKVGGHDLAAPLSRAHEELPGLSNEERFGDKFVQLGNWLPRTLARGLFKKYGEVVKLADGTEQYVKENFIGAAGTDSASARFIAERMLQRGKRLIEEFYDVISGLAFQYEMSMGKGVLGRAFSEDADENAMAEYRQMETEEFSKLEGKLARLNWQTLLFLSSLKILHDEGANVNLKDILNVDVRAAAPDELSAEEIVEMRAIYAKNYEHMPELQELLLKKFDECVVSSTDNKNIFYVLRHRDADGAFRVRSFFRLEDIGGPTRYREYFGAFNVDPEYRGSAVGDLMMEQYLDWRTHDGSTIEADCDIRAPVTANYFSRGFFGVGTGKFGEADTVHIVATDESWQCFELVTDDASMTRARIGEVVEEESSWVPGGRIVIAAEPLSRIDKIPFHLLDQADGPMRFVLTRYMRKPSDELGEDVVYAVFESISRENFEMLIEGNELWDENDVRLTTRWPGHDEPTIPQTSAPETPHPAPVEELRKAA